MGDYRLFEAGELGEDGYPAVWHYRLKHEVRERAEHRCIRCLHPYEKGAGEWSPCDEQCAHAGPWRWKAQSDEWFLCDVDESPEEVYSLANTVRVPGTTVEARWRILTVHHLDGNKANCRWWNLAALCQRCHLQIQGKVLMERVYPWEHSDWFKPYVAGYYAHVYLGEQLSREQVEDRLDELLGLELGVAKS